MQAYAVRVACQRGRTVDRVLFRYNIMQPSKVPPTMAAPRRRSLFRPVLPLLGEFIMGITNNIIDTTDAT